FEALSYTWGDRTSNRSLRKTQGRLEVTPNCLAALEDRRHQNQGRTLWIDAICINQHSNTEKNHQVPLMNQIYSKATQLLIYIG
ncbi:heterokaryon incompatibility, partial [Bimuria novae-zelandiae CBS 107.79]